VVQAASALAINAAAIVTHDRDFSRVHSAAGLFLSRTQSGFVRNGDLMETAGVL
jgi:hypothetical protein